MTGSDLADLELRPSADKSGIVPVGTIDPYVGDMGPPWARCRAEPKNERVLDKLLMELIARGATHARLVLAGDCPELRLRVDDGWRKAEKIPTSIVSGLREQLKQLEMLAMPSGVDGICHTVAYRTGGKTSRFRLFVGGGRKPTIITVLSANVEEVHIFDSPVRRERRSAIDDGVRALHAGDRIAARIHLERAIELSVGYQQPSSKIRALLAFAQCEAQDGEALAAERCYKSAAAVIAHAFGRSDLQLIRVYRALAACAANRGDKAVADMWEARQADVWNQFE